MRICFHFSSQVKAMVEAKEAARLRAEEGKRAAEAAELEKARLKEEEFHAKVTSPRIV